MIAIDYIGQAIKLLDEYNLRDENGQYVNWADRIELEELDFYSVTKCVLGQVFGKYLDGKRNLGLMYGTGFTAVWDGNEWVELRNSDRMRWIEEIRKRQSKEEA